MSELQDATVSYKAAKAIKEGMSLWCLWSTKDPFKGTYGRNGFEKPTGFVVNDPATMRKMSMDMLRLADELEAYAKMWEDDS